MMALQHHPSDDDVSRARWTNSNAYTRKPRNAPKIMSIACHPYLSGVPHRIGHVQRTFKELLARDGVVAWNGEQILDWYLGQKA